MNRAFPEYVGEHAALAWPACNGWSVRDGVAVAPGDTVTKCDDYGQVVLGRRQRLPSRTWLFSGEGKVRDAGRDQ